MRLFAPASLMVIGTLWLATPAGAQCSPPDCGTVALPFSVNFSGDRGGLPDRNGIGTGFTIVDVPSRGAGFQQQLLGLDTAAGRLAIETTPGIAYRALNSLDNALGVGVTPRGGAFALRTTLVDIPVAGGYAQAGLWFGASEDEYVKLVVIATPTGTRVQLLRESGGTARGYYDPVPIAIEGAAVSLRLRVDPGGGSVTGAYSINGGPARQIKTMPVSPALLYRGLHMNEPVATGGIFATHRLHAAPLSYAFDDFEAACVNACVPAPPPPDPDFGDGDPPVGEPSDDSDPSDGDVPGSIPLRRPVPAAPAPAPAGGDTGPNAAPRASLALPRRVRLSTLRRRGLRGVLTCSARCTFDARLQVSGRVARNLRARSVAMAPLVVARSRGAAGANGKMRFAVRPTKQTSRRLAAMNARRVRATVRLRVAFAPDVSRVIRRTVVLTGL
jgi:hypothetical protein